MTRSEMSAMGGTSVRRAAGESARRSVRRSSRVTSTSTATVISSTSMTYNFPN